MVYSFGPDGKDDGGAVAAYDRAGRKQRDFGIRLWDPAHRRAPAPPPEPKDEDSVPGADEPEVAPPPRERP